MLATFVADLQRGAKNKKKKSPLLHLLGSPQHSPPTSGPIGSTQRQKEDGKHEQKLIQVKVKEQWLGSESSFCVFVQGGAAWQQEEENNLTERESWRGKKKKKIEG